MFDNNFHYQTPKACFPRICTAFPRTQKRSPCNAATSGGIFEGVSPKVGTPSQVGASKSGLTQPGSRRASQFCDSAIRQTGQRVIIEMHSILSRLHRSVQSVRLTPSTQAAMLTLFVLGANLVHTLVYRVGIRYRSPHKRGYIGIVICDTPEAWAYSSPLYSRMI